MNASPGRNFHVYTFSLRILFIVVTLFACCFAFYSFRFQSLRQNNAAIAKIRDAGASVFLANSRGIVTDNVEVGSATLISVMADNPDFVVHVDLSEPDLTANVIRKLIPYLQMLIPSDMYDAGNRFVTLELSGNPNISPDLIEELRKRLPNCKFVKYTPVPTGTLNVIETGMSQEQVIRTIGTLMYDQRTAWPGDKMQTINMLGSQMNVKYKNSDGFATWTYFTDDIGVGVLGIDFDKDQNVAAVWSDRGIPRSRKLTPIAPPVVGGL